MNPYTYLAPEEISASGARWWWDRRFRMVESDVECKTEWKVVFEGHYKAPDIKEGYKEPVGSKHMFTRGTNSSGKWMPHIGLGALKSCVNGAINEAMKDIQDGGYITIEVKVVNP